MAHPAVVRQWLRKGKARMHRFGPPVARLLCPHAEACLLRHWGRGSVDVGLDPGSETGGIAVVRNDVLIWCAEVWFRSKAIVRCLRTRSAVRSARRCRVKLKTGRPRKEARFRHRKRPEGWLAPSVWHRVASHMRWARFAMAYACAGADSVRVHVEVCAFDTHAVLNPGVRGKGYQQGPLFRANLRGFVLARDGARCRYCGAKGVPLGMDHIVAKSRGGPDAPWNRMPACRACDNEKDDLDLEEWVRVSPRVPEHRGAAAVRHARKLAQGMVPLKAMAAANVVAPAIARECRKLGWNIVETSGADTASWRRDQAVGKSHAFDAMCTAAKDRLVSHRSMRPLRIHMTGRGRRLVRQVNKAGFPRLKQVETTFDGRRAWTNVPVVGHHETPPCGLRAGDTVLIHKPGFGRRRRVAIATSVRHDGRCMVKIGEAKPFHIMASMLTLAHHGLGARIS